MARNVNLRYTVRSGLTQADVERVAFCAIWPTQLVHVIVAVIARFSRVERRVRFVDDVDKIAETRPLVQT